MAQNPRHPKAPAKPEPAASLHRSGAVARMLRMPVATLRVWERRYALTDTALSPSGQRLYSADDVRRLGLLKQLTDLGHAIGSLASLDMAQLQRVAATHAQALVATQPVRRAEAAGARPAGPPRVWRLVVVGQALGARLQRSALLRQLGRPVEVLGPFASLSQAASAMSAEPGGAKADAWLLHEPQLHADRLAAIEAVAPPMGEPEPEPAQPQRKARSQMPVPKPQAQTPPPASSQAPSQRPPQVPMAVLYGYAPEAACEALAARGVALLREPQPDVVLAQWLRRWADASAAPAPGRGGAGPAAQAAAAITPRRWGDAALADFAALSTTVACECPRHVAELLTQLSRFEDYSAQCQHRSPDDAELHGHLRRVAAEARTAFEAALEQVALHEGLLLPPSQPPGA